MKTYKYKLYRAKRNKHLHQQIDSAGMIYNHCIALHKRSYRRYKKHLRCHKLQKHITKLKKLPKYAFWNLVGSQAIQDIVQRIDKAYQRFFDNQQKGIKSSPPGFKKVKKYKSFTLKQAGWKLLEGNRVVLQGRVYKYFKSREIQGWVKTVTVKRDPLGDVSLCFTVKQEITPPDSRGNTRVCGFDFGLKTFLTSSHNSDIHSPLFFRQAQKEINAANRAHSRKQQGSKAQGRARRQLARVHKNVANRRLDYHFKLAHQLTEDYDVLVFESLNLKGMQQLWGKKVSDLGFSNFLNILDYVAAVNGTTVCFLDQWEPTSKPCSVCGSLYHELSLKERSWTCPHCGTSHDRDKNAALNIEALGRQRLGIGDGRPALQAVAV